eukprot:GHVN01082631.1.p1 GENE.GHVN01082631.1~~GHVN01082631.1.p1  ORF type:complete len:171 (-),score=8.63 GHVN01082631.1:130-642(-)
MSNSICSAFCADYTYFGLQVNQKGGNTCWCGDNADYDRYGRNVTEVIADCPSPPELCGGRWITAVYQRMKRPSYNRHSRVLFKVEDGGEFKKLVHASIMSINACALLCKEYKFFSINNKDSKGQCKCFETGWKYGQYNGIPRDELGHLDRCMGNRTQTCGNYYADEVYTG